MKEDEINKKALDAYPEKYVQMPFCRSANDINEDHREGYKKALNDIESLPKMKGWVARDKKWFDEENRLTFFFTKPERYTSILAVSEGWWNAKSDEHCCEGFRIDKNLFPELTWEDEPIEVELIIRKL